MKGIVYGICGSEFGVILEDHSSLESQEELSNEVKTWFGLCEILSTNFTMGIAIYNPHDARLSLT